MYLDDTGDKLAIVLHIRQQTGIRLLNISTLILMTKTFYNVIELAKIYKLSGKFNGIAVLLFTAVVYSA